MEAPWLLLSTTCTNLPNVSLCSCGLRAIPNDLAAMVLVEADSNPSEVRIPWRGKQLPARIWSLRISATDVSSKVCHGQIHER